MSSAGHARRASILGALGALLLAAISIPLNHLLGGLGVSLPAGIEAALLWTPFFIWTVASANGGTACLRHLALRFALWRAGVPPEYATIRPNAG